MKTKIERFALGLILAPLAPIAGLLIFWWGSYALLPESWIPYCGLGGLGLGILADLFFLKKLIGRAYNLGAVFWVAVLLFYSVGTFGFFMGVPIFNAALAIPAGFIIGGKLAHETTDGVRIRRASLRTSILTTVAAGADLRRLRRHCLAQPIHCKRPARYAWTGFRSHPGHDLGTHPGRRGGPAGRQLGADRTLGPHFLSLFKGMI